MHMISFACFMSKVSSSCSDSLILHDSVICELAADEVAGAGSELDGSGVNSD